MAHMDDTPTDDLISQLKNVDPADSPDVADRVADELATELDGTESTEAEGSDPSTEAESGAAQADAEPNDPSETEDEH